MVKYNSLLDKRFNYILNKIVDEKRLFLLKKNDRYIVNADSEAIKNLENFKNMNFEESGNPDSMTILAFALVIFSVVASSIGQNVEIHLRTKDLLPLKIRFDFSFIKNLLSKNRKYGFSYFFSSFHTLLVLMFLGRFYPTASGFKYAGIWALALSLIEILLIVPSSLGNSLLHKIPHYSAENKKKSL